MEEIKSKGGRPKGSSYCVHGHPLSQCTCGRPPEMTEEKIKKLEEAFALDASIGEACFYAEISKQTYYNWLKKKPELVDRFDALREKPVLMARQTVVKSLKDNPEMALKYLERKRRKEFATRVEQEHEGTLSVDLSAKAKELLNKYKKDESQPSSGELAQ